MSTIRNAELYVPAELMAKLRFIAEVAQHDSPDSYAAQVLSEHLAAMYPNLDAVMVEANRARRKVLDEAKQTLSVEIDKQNMAQQTKQPKEKTDMCRPDKPRIIKGGK